MTCRRFFALDTDVSVRSYVVWLLTFGLREMEISVDQLGDGLQSYLRSESPWQPLLERVLELLRDARGSTAAIRHHHRGWTSCAQDLVVEQCNRVP